MKFTYLKTEYDIDEELSFKNFTNVEFKSRPEINFNNKIIYESCFYNETPDSDIFGDMQNVTFIKCNLDNLIIPASCTVIDCRQERFKAQNDLNDWLIDGDDKPVKPIDFKIYEKFGLPMPDPKDIPTEKVSEVINLKKVAEEKKALLDNKEIK